MRELELNHGVVTLIDDDDYENIKAYRWYIKPFHGVARAYVFRKTARSEHPFRKQSSIQLHRQIMGLTIGDSRIVDHINGNSLDNRKCNLRIGTRQQNNWSARLRCDSSTGYKGVHFKKQKQKYQAYIRHNGRVKHLGFYTLKEEAAEAYNNKAKELFGAFAYLNTIEEKQT